MSYPLHKVSGGSAARTVRTENGFWGLDLSQSALDRSFSRAMDTENLIWQGESLAVRPGYQRVTQLSGRINGIYSYQGALILHAGTNLYRLEKGGSPIKLDAVLADTPSYGVVRCQTVTRRYCLTPYSNQWVRRSVTGDFLFLNDGTHYLFYDGEYVRPVADDHWGEDLFTLHNSGITVQYYATVPFTAVAKRPDSAAGDLDPRGDNRLSQFRCESFYVGSGETFKSFRLNCLLSAFNQRVPLEVQLRDTEGIWRCIGSADIKATAARESELVRVTTPSLKAGTSFRCSDWDIIVEFGTGDYVFADDGMDNVRITYGVKKDPPRALTGATVQGLYGADGADDVLFLGGSAVAPGEDAFSARNNFFCFYETATELLGSNKTPVTGYCRLSDGRLAVLKDDPDGSTVFFRSHKLLEVGTTQSGEPYQIDVFPSRTGAAVEGCVASHSVGVAGNEPCFLAKSGLYSVRSVSNELTNLHETVRRSVPIDALLCTLSAEAARCISWQGYYLMTFGKTAFITDGRRDSSGYLRFLKWTLAHSMTALGQWEGRLYLGDASGNLYLFGEGTDDAGIAFPAFWKTPMLEDKTGRRVLLRRMWAAVSPAYGAAVTVQLFRDRCPGYERKIALHLPDFGDWDFGSVSFDGTADPRWIPLTLRSDAAGAFSVLFDMRAAAGLQLWGFRMTYEKGGMMQ